MDLYTTMSEVRRASPSSSSFSIDALLVAEFDEATSYFTSLQKADPYRVEDIDIFSNILYVSEKRAELAMLAQEYTKMDRSRPEVCCLVGAYFPVPLDSYPSLTLSLDFTGNYYSLRREHEKAIIYFRRALKLDRGYLSAWTLMGHEYVEIKNTNAAIASYRRAVGVSASRCILRSRSSSLVASDVNRKDYRAWYGLGQTYELLGEPFYALNYYQKATALRPYDARMWSALAICYEKLKRCATYPRLKWRELIVSDFAASPTPSKLTNALWSQASPARTTPPSASAVSTLSSVIRWQQLNTIVARYTKVSRRTPARLS